MGDLDSENAGRLGLWQVCQKMEMSDNCQRQLVDVLAIPSMPFQVRNNTHCIVFAFETSVLC